MIKYHTMEVERLSFLEMANDKYSTRVTTGVFPCVGPVRFVAHSWFLEWPIFFAILGSVD